MWPDAGFAQEFREARNTSERAADRRPAAPGTRTLAVIYGA
jgi:hypothetical protein